MSRRRFHSDTRVSENFTQSGLETLTGQRASDWARYVLKESLDNALEAAEAAGCDPAIKVHVKGESGGRPAPWAPTEISVRDNGPGISKSRVEKIFEDIDRFGGTKRHYNLPTRGNQGNALMTILGIQNLAGGSLTIRTHGKKHQISVEEDQFTGEPRIDLDTDVADVEGTEVAVDLSGADFGDGQQITETLGAFVALNPHVSFDISLDSGDPGTIEHKFPAVEDSTVGRFSLSDESTTGKPNWFSPNAFRERVRADVRATPELTVGEFVAEFAKVTEAKRDTIFSGLDYRDESVRKLVSGDDDRIRKLHDRMRDVTEPYSERRLKKTVGGIGTDLRNGLMDYLEFTGQKSEVEELAEELDGFDTLEDLCIYFGDGKVVSGGDRNMPFFFEAAAVPKADPSESTTLVFGINQSVSYSTPSVGLKLKHRGGKTRHHYGIEGAFDRTGHPYHVIANLTCPNLTFQDKGKQKFDAGPFKPVISDVVGKVVRKVERNIRPRLNDLREEPNPGPSEEEEEFERKRAPSGFIKDYVFDNFREAYGRATDGGKYTLMMNQLYYEMRPGFNKLAERKGYEYSPNAVFDGAKPNKHKKPLKLRRDTFRKKVDEFEREVLGKRLIHRDKRGFFVEPHSNEKVDLQTKPVGQYEPDLDQYGNLLFIEKTGFFELLHKDFQLTKKFDIAPIMAKGFSTIAGRDLVEKIQHCDDDITLYLLADLDIKGLGIAEDASKADALSAIQGFNTVRLGVTLKDVEEYDLPVEPRDYKERTLTELRNKYKAGEVSEEVFDFLTKNGGQGVEINALSPVELREYLTDKFEEHGIEKVEPEEEDVEEPDVKAPKEVCELATKKAIGDWVIEQTEGEITDALDSADISFDSDAAEELKELTEEGRRSVLKSILEELEKYPPKNWKKIQREKIKDIESDAEDNAEEYEQAVRDEVMDWLEKNVTIDMQTGR